MLMKLYKVISGPSVAIAEAPILGVRWCMFTIISFGYDESLEFIVRTNDIALEADVLRTVR